MSMDQYEHTTPQAPVLEKRESGENTESGEVGAAMDAVASGADSFSNNGITAAGANDSAPVSGAGGNGKVRALLTPRLTIGSCLYFSILAMGLTIIVLRFTTGLGGVTALDDNTPWGLWIAFDLMCGVVLGAGRYSTSTAGYHLLGLKHFYPLVRPSLASAFIGYSFVLVALLFDLGQPWRMPYPLLFSQGTTSVLFESALCISLYLTVLVVQSSPLILSRFGLFSLRRIVESWSVPLTLIGLTLFTLHQSSLGGLFLIAPYKMHPLWFSDYLPLFFFISSLYAGTCMVIFEGLFVRWFLQPFMSDLERQWAENVVFALSKASAAIMMSYAAMRILGVALDGDWPYLNSWYGVLFFVEIVVCTMLPAVLLTVAARERMFYLARWSSVLAVLGVVLSRFNVCLVAFNYNLPADERYFPAWTEIGFSVFSATLIITAYRFIYPKRSRATPEESAA